MEPSKKDWTNDSGLMPDEIAGINRAAFHDSAVYTQMREWLYKNYAVMPPIADDEEELDLPKMALRAMRLRGTESLMESGCGAGEFIIMTAESGHRGQIIGTDISPTYGPAEIILADYKNVSFRQADAKNLSFLASESLDRVAANRMLYHVDQPQAAIQEFGRVLVPGGIFTALNRGHFNMVRHWDSINEALEELGYEPIDTPYINFDSEDAAFRINSDEQFDVVPNPEYDRLVELSRESFAEYFEDTPFEPLAKLALTSTRSSILRPLAMDEEAYFFYSESIFSFVRAAIIQQSSAREEELPPDLTGLVTGAIDSTLKKEFHEEISTSRHHRFSDIAQDGMVVAVKRADPTA